MALPHTLNVLVIMRPDAARAARIVAVAPERVRVTELSAVTIAGEGGALWPARSGGLIAAEPVQGIPRDDVDRALREADVVLLGLPYPVRLRERLARVRWVHHPFAGVSNLRASDLWGTSAVVTSGRGHTGVLPIAETTLAAVLMFAKGLHTAAKGTASGAQKPGEFHNVMVRGKTLGIIGLGGIGHEVARLAKAVSMRVVATRRSAVRRQRDVDGVDELFPASETLEMLPQCDYVAICAMLTPETERLANGRFFAAMKPGAYLLNIARGEIVDEAALKDALRSGKLGGAYLDVYANEFTQSPDRELIAMPNVVWTPHVSPQNDEGGRHQQGFDVFYENLAAFLEGKPMKNLVDWGRGY